MPPVNRRPRSRHTRGRATVAAIAAATVLMFLLVAIAPTASADHVSKSSVRWACGFNEGDPLDGCRIDPLGGDGVGAAGPAEWGSAEDAWIGAEDAVLGIEIDGDARAVPVIIGDRHEIVNTEIGGVPVAITYCPLCGSGITFDRRVDVDGSTHLMAFTASGYLYRNDLVMWDPATETLWNQITGTPIGTIVDGRASMEHIDATLAWVPTSVTTWEEWQRAHPDTLLLQPHFSPGSYRGAYPGYDDDCRHGLGGSDCDVAGIHPKERVVATEANGGVAFPLFGVQSAGGVAIHDGTVASVTDGGAAVLFDGTEHTFTQDPSGLWMDADGALWDLATGSRVDGGQQLATLDSAVMFWFAWKDHHPDTAVWQEDEANRTLELEPKRTPLPGWLGLAGIAGAAGMIAVLSRRDRRRSS